MTEEVVPSAAAGKALTQPARFAFDVDQLATIKRTVAKDCSDAEFALFCEVVARYELDPFTGHVYAAKMGGRDGTGGAMTIIVGRDGLNALADRDPSYRGMVSAVVHEHDRFEATLLPDGQWQVSYTAAKKAEAGPIIGSFALVRRAGRLDTYVYSDFSEFNTGKSTWAKFPGRMIRKVSESAALRLAFPIKLPTGVNVIGEEEFDAASSHGSVTVDDSSIDWGPDPVFGTFLRLLFAEANRVSPDAFRPRKIAFKLAGIDDGERAKIARDLEAFILRHNGTVPTPDDVQAAMAAPEEEVEEVDAEIVTEPAGDAA